MSHKKSGHIKGTERIISDEDEEYIQLLVTSNPTIYRAKIHEFLVEHSNSVCHKDDISISTIQRTIWWHFRDETTWTRKKTLQCNDLLWTPENIAYTQEYLNTIQWFDVDDLLFMDKSSVNINCGVQKYSFTWKGHCAVHFSKQLTGANYTLHVIVGLHGKMYYEITSDLVIL